MPVVTEAIAPQVRVSGDTGRFRVPIASATFAIVSAAPWPIWPRPLNHRRDFLGDSSAASFLLRSASRSNSASALLISSSMCLSSCRTVSSRD